MSAGAAEAAAVRICSCLWVRQISQAALCKGAQGPLSLGCPTLSKNLCVPGLAEVHTAAAARLQHRAGRPPTCAEGCHGVLAAHDGPGGVQLRPVGDLLWAKHRRHHLRRREMSPQRGAGVVVQAIRTVEWQAAPVRPSARHACRTLVLPISKMALPSADCSTPSSHLSCRSSLGRLPSSLRPSGLRNSMPPAPGCESWIHVLDANQVAVTSADRSQPCVFAAA